MAGAGRRLVLEAIFLVGLAVAAGLAEFSTEEIIEVMALGWLVTVLIELVAWRLAVRRPAVEERTVATARPTPVIAAPPPQAVEPAPEAEPEVVAEPDPQVVAEQEPEDEDEGAGVEAPGGPQPAEPKRGGLFGWRRREETSGEITDETPPPPRHVRLIERAEPTAGDDSADDRDVAAADQTSGAGDDTAGDRDAPPAERAGGA